MSKTQFEHLLNTYERYRECGWAPREALIETAEDFVFIYGDGSQPQGILEASEVTELKEVRPAK